MSSISVSDYRLACNRRVQIALKYRNMFFENLRELEISFGGYDAAYGEVLELSHDQLFNVAFRKWLYETKGLSCASGWAFAIEQRGQQSGEDCVELFAKYIESFFEHWK